MFTPRKLTATSAGSHAHFKAQTRLWGYDLKSPQSPGRDHQRAGWSRLTSRGIKPSRRRTPSLDALHAWERQAEDNVLDAWSAPACWPRQRVEKVLETVVNNLVVTNNLDIQPEVRCRVLLTTPLESFTIGHTIVISRGLIDTLPDEASLAMVLAHELGHIVLGHRLDTK